MLTGVHSEKFSTVIHHGGFIVRRPRFKFTGKLVDYFDNLDVDTMSMFEIVAMVEKLGITYNVKVFWQLVDKPIEVKQLKNDGDVMEMVSNLPRDHYVHLYLEEVVGFSETKMDEPGLGEAEIDEPGLGEAEMDEPDIGEPEMDEHVMDEPELGEPEMDEHESEVRLESESDSEDEEYVARSESSSAVSSFSDRENEIVSSEDEVDEESNVNVGLGSDEVDVQSESGHSDSLHSVGEADSDGAQSKPRFPKFNRKTDMSNPTLKVGLIFANKAVLKEAIKMYGIKNRYSVKLKRNDSKRIQVTCKSGCTWVLWVTPINGEDPNTGTWQIRSVHGEHNCLREFVNPNVTSKWLAKKYFNNFFIDPTFSSTSLKQAVHKDWGITVNKSKCVRAKNFALEKLHGNYSEQYAKLYAYLAELRGSNPGTTTVCKLDEGRFERLYLCMQAMKDGFKAGCRPIIGLDGCHLKGYYQGHLLAAMGIDADDSIYPIAFTVVENQKGLMEAVLEQFPYSEHRTCVRHLYSNSKTNGFTGKTLKDQLWKAARATYEREFQSAMAELKGLSKTAWDWLAPKDPRMWSKSHFSVRCKCWPIHAGGHMYQVSCGPAHQHSVNIEAWTCSCRKWELTDRPEKYVHQSYFVSTQRAIYSHLISPVRGEKQWTVEETMEPILPPLFRRPPGRPHKKRKREIDEPIPQPGKVSRRGVKIFCKKCGGTGHNIRTCKGRVGGNIRGPGQTSTSSARAPRISKLPTRRPTTTLTSHGENSPRPTPTCHGGNSPRPTLLPTQPLEVHITRWMPTPTTTNHAGTPPTTAHGGTSPRPTPLLTQPSQGHTARWMPTPTTTTTHAGTPPISAHGGTSPRPTPLPTQPSQGHTVRWMPTPTATTHLSQESSTNQPSPRVDP
ncbi:hypothetical protein V6N13_049407 [Hibiscus sabdariffa]